MRTLAEAAVVYSPNDVDPALTRVSGSRSRIRATETVQRTRIVAAA